MITNEQFRKHWPRLMLVRPLDPFEAQERGLPNDRTWYLFMAPFVFVSALWGEIANEEGDVIDFGSVPKPLHGVVDNDGPTMCFPSCPHDKLFQRRADGTRGWLKDGRQLSLHQVNCVLYEAQVTCGAGELERNLVFAAVQLANRGIAHEFAP